MSCFDGWCDWRVCKAHYAIAHYDWVYTCKTVIDT